MPTDVAPAKQAVEPVSDDALVAELEELWTSSPAVPPAPAGEPVRRRIDVYRRLPRALVLGWAAFFVAIFVLAPAADPAVATPAWVDAASVAILLGIGGAALTAGFAPGFALACSALAAGLGVPVGIACRATEHHIGSWWIVETGAFAALAVASIACLAARRRA